jgi:hypothetical protein
MYETDNETVSETLTDTDDKRNEKDTLGQVKHVKENETTFLVTPQYIHGQIVTIAPLLNLHSVEEL